MPWCPKCGTEYRPEFDICADCGEALVAEGPQTAESLKQPSRLVTAIRYAGTCLLATITILAACTMTVARDEWSPIPPAIGIGMLCCGGILCSVIHPKSRLGSSLLLWFIAASPLLAPLLVAISDEVETNGYGYGFRAQAESVLFVLAAVGIGAITGALAAKCYSGKAMRHALELALTISIFLSLPFGIDWWHQTM